MQLNNLKRKTKNQKKKTVGRGGSRGKTSGRGHKGHGQHGSSGIRPQIRDIIKKFPKLRGHGKNRARTVNSGKDPVVSVSLSAIDATMKDGAVVTPKNLVKSGVIEMIKGKTPQVKILANGDITKKVKVIDCKVSALAQEKITKAGGEVKSSK